MEKASRKIKLSKNSLMQLFFYSFKLKEKHFRNTEKGPLASKLQVWDSMYVWLTGEPAGVQSQPGYVCVLFLLF